MSSRPHDARTGVVSVYGGMARLCDKQALDALLPDVESLRTKIQRPCITHQWDPLYGDVWIFSRDQTVVFLYVDGLSEAEATRARWLVKERLNRSIFTLALVERVLREATRNRRRPKASKNAGSR